VQFAGGFPTPSGKIEIASAHAAADGHPRLPEPSVDVPAPAGYLRLLSPASPWLMNSTFGNDAKLRKRIGPASVALHPSEAAGRGLRKGDEVVLRNSTGELRLTVDITDSVPQGVAYAPKCRWPSHESAGANVNTLNPGAKTDMGESSAVHGVLVELVPG
jgi:anaerobic selenocysteine-containing dehydrogenase